MIDKIKNFIETIGTVNEPPIDPANRLFIEPECNGFLPFNTASVKLKAYNDVTKSQRLNNISVQWFRQFEGRNYSIDNIEDSYNFSCDDIGSKIIGIVTDNDRPNVIESISFGPVTLDPQCRNELEILFRAGRAIFEVQLPYRNIGNELLLKPPEFKDSSRFIIDEVALTPESMALIHSKGTNSILPLKSLKFEPLPGFPLIVMVRIGSDIENELGELEIRIHEESESYFYLKFFNRIFRENFLMLSKLFLEVKVQSYVNQLALWESKGIDKGFFTSRVSGILAQSGYGVADLLLQLDRMRDSLNRNVSYTKTVIEDRSSLIDYSEGLERDLKTTLKDLKDLVIKQKLQSQFDVSKLEKVECSILDINNRKNRDNGSKLDIVSGNLIGNLRLQRLQEENEKVEKLNKVLLRELNGYRDKRKEKIRSINQSLNELNKEIAQQAQHLNTVAVVGNGHSMDVSKYLENFDNHAITKSMAKKTSPQILEENVSGHKDSKRFLSNHGMIEEKSHRSIREKDPLVENSILITEKAELRQQVISLKKRIHEMENQCSVNGRPVDPYFEAHFNEIRNLIQNYSQIEIKNESGDLSNGSGLIDSDFSETLRKMIRTNKMELLNIENEALSQRNAYLLNLIKQATPEKEIEQSLKTLFSTLQNKIDSLRAENHRLSQELEKIEKSGGNSDSLVRKQNLVIKTELDRLKQENEQLVSRSLENKNDDERIKLLELQLEEKEKVLHRAMLTNKSLAEEVNRLQDIIIMEESLNMSSAKD
jgi:hypothetical protein